MNHRPWPVSVIAWLLIAVGVAGSAYHFHELTPQHAFQGANVWIFVVEAVAIVCGYFLLRGKLWARWLALAWITTHFVVSFFDSWNKVAVHAVILLLFAYALFCAEARAYFRRQGTSTD